MSVAILAQTVWASRGCFETSCTGVGYVPVLRRHVTPWATAPLLGDCRVAVLHETLSAFGFQLSDGVG